jgi:hypothetical protein
MPWLEALGGVDPAAFQPPAAQASQVPWIQAAVAFQAAEVIEEPEQIEVQQADPNRAVVVDLEPLDEPEAAALAGPEQEPAPQAVDATPQPRWSPAEEAELARGLLSVVLR